MQEQFVRLPAPAAPKTSTSLKAPKRSAPAAEGRWALGLQVLALAIVVAVGFWLIRNATINLASRHISAGFGFLKDSAGFAIAEGPLSFDSGDTYARAFILGVLNTVRAAIPAVILATALGFTLGIAQISRHPLVQLVSRTIVDLVRNVPLVVQVLFWYFMLTALLPDNDTPLHFGAVLFLSKGGFAFPEPSFSVVRAVAGVMLTVTLPWLAHRFGRKRVGVLPLVCLLVLAAWCVLPQSWQMPELGTFGISGGMTLSPEWLAVVFALTLYSGAYCAEIVRAGLLAVPQGQWEAAHALGLSRRQTLWRVIVPQSLRVIVPPYTSLVTSTIKNSSLAIVVGYPDIVSIANTTLNQNGQAIECLVIIATVYLLLNLLSASVMAVVNARVQFHER